MKYKVYVCPEADDSHGRIIEIWAVDPQGAFKYANEHIEQTEMIYEIIEAEQRQGHKGRIIVYDYFNGYLEI